MYDKYSYRVTWSEEDQEYVGLCAELPSLSYLATTQAQALRGITKLTASVIEDMQKTGEKIPCPTSTKQYSGKFMVRVPPAVHRLLAINALEAHVSLNRYVSTILATGSTNV